MFGKDTKKSHDYEDNILTKLKDEHNYRVKTLEKQLENVTESLNEKGNRSNRSNKSNSN